LFPLEALAGPAGTRLDHYLLEATSITAYIQTKAATASCPICETPSNRVHSRYRRKLGDLACFGKKARLVIAVRRFFCTQPQCSRRIFAERLSGFARPYARTTDRLRQAHEAIGSAVGGEPGSRLTVHLAINSSPDTLLRRVKQLDDESLPPPRIVGIDDWAWRRGRRYGTIVVDLERGDVIDLLPDRDAATVGKWLDEHPGVELVSRDRSSSYARAATESAPNARQVADRWHLLKNLREAIERVFEQESKLVNAALTEIEAAAGSASSSAAPGTDGVSASDKPSSSQSSIESAVESPRRQAQRSRRQSRVARFEQVHERNGQGHSVRRIARELGMSRCAVRRYLRCETCPDWNLRRKRRSRLDQHREWIDAQLAEGTINAMELHRRLTGMGFQGSYGSVRRYVTKRLAAAGKSRERINAAKSSPACLPTAKQLSFEWVRRSEKRKPAEQARLDAIRGCSTELACVLDLADEFAAMIRKQSRDSLGEWLVKAEASTCLGLRVFAEGIRRDEAAVHAAITERWSNGPVEGHVNRLKTIKRQMYGRGGFRLLRARVVRVA
jgi:transposase